MTPFHRLGFALSFAIGLLVSTVSLAASAPMISSAQLKLGRHWTWTYYKQGNLSDIYSAERYEVVEVKGSKVTIEIQSQYGGTGGFHANTRFRVDTENCLHAFIEPELKVEFLIDLFPFQDGQWAKVPYQVQSTAFEEKFNCDPYVHRGKSSLYETRFESESTPWGEMRLFQQWPKLPQSQLRSFYFQDGAETAGIAYRKEFNPDTPDHFTMLLTGWGDGN